jgi:hypothetical protein
MIFLSPHFLGLSDQSYAQKMQEQQEFQANEEAVRITGLLPLTHVFPDTFETLGGALLSFPEPSPGSQCLLRSLETDPANPSVLFFCTHYSNVSYLESLIETLFPTLRQIYPTLTPEDVWLAPDHHHTTQTLEDLLSHSNTTLSHLLDFTPYGLSDTPALPNPTSHNRSRPVSRYGKGSRGRRNHRGPVPSPSAHSSNHPHPSETTYPALTPNPWYNSPPSLSSTTLSTAFETTTNSELQSLTTTLLTLQAQVDTLTTHIATQVSLAPTPTSDTTDIAALDISLEHSTPPFSLSALRAAIEATIKVSLQEEVLPQLSALITREVSSTINSSEFGNAISENIRQQLVFHFHPPVSQISAAESSQPTPLITGGDDSED